MMNSLKGDRLHATTVELSDVSVNYSQKPDGKSGFPGNIDLVGKQNGLVKQGIHKHLPGEGMLVVIDPNVENYQMLAAGVREGARAIVLDSNKDGIEQITRALTDGVFSSLHIVCHGAPGKLYLGQTSVNQGNLLGYRQQLLEWGVAEIMLYACEVAAGDMGAAFVEQLIRLTGANIAASTQRVGNAALGGSWDLESYGGKVSSELAFVSDVVREYSGVFIEVFEGSDDNDTLTGTSISDDIIIGFNGDDKLYGYEGDDLLIGNDGKDRLYGGDNNDLLIGGDGNDKLYGNKGSDRLDGNEGNDSLNGNEGNDRLYGDEGNDSLKGNDGNDLLYGGNNNDLLIGGKGNDKLYGNKGRDNLDGGEGNDRLYGDEGNDSLYGGLGEDRLYGGDGNDSLYGEDGKDRLYGGDGEDSLEGNESDDRLYGGDGNDSLYGDEGNDRLYGGDGEDSLEGGLGNDELIGGNGNDTLTGVVKYSGMGGKGEIDTLTGGSGDDWFILGDSGGFVYYNDDILGDPGLGDYALISDFDTAEDKIQLQGTAADYMLSFEDGVGTRIIRIAGGDSELIAIVSGIDLTLTIGTDPGMGSYFTFV